MTLDLGFHAVDIEATDPRHGTFLNAEHNEQTVRLVFVMRIHFRCHARIEKSLRLVKAGQGSDVVIKKILAEHAARARKLPALKAENREELLFWDRPNALEIKSDKRALHSAVGGVGDVNG